MEWKAASLPSFRVQRLFDTLASLRDEAAKGALFCLTP